MDISFLFRNYTWTYLPVKGNEFSNATIKTSVRVGRTSDSTERGASLSPLVLSILLSPLLLSSLTTSLTHSSLSLLRICWSLE